ncbi:MAG: bifunctional diaminohydroxyphosphoribosylaminopyrimidine deaminase/5-amino-6-(5-phosphoribosylamino)uracil reductase RibD [bacterium]
MKKDEIYMKAAIEKAGKAKGKTRVNPLVGCVIVKNDRIISEGYHKGPGSVHAEIMAINSASESLSGSTMYVTLEPCNVWGHTPPCVETIEQIQFERIVIGTTDPNPLVSGRSVARLKKKYKVDLHVLEDEAKNLNPYFRNFMESKKTYIVMKAALTLDSFLEFKRGKTKRFTCEESLKRVHRDRYKADAILVGSGTVNADDPILDCRMYDRKYKPSVIVLDFSNKADYSKKIFCDNNRKKIVFVSDKYKNKLEEKTDIKYFFIKSKRDAWKLIKNELWRENIISVFVEGGGSVFTGALASGYIDELHLYYAPFFSGSGTKISFKRKLKSAFKLIEASISGVDIYARYVCLRD